MSATPAVQDLKASLPQAKGDETEERIPIELTVAPGRTVTARLPRSAIGRVGVVTLVPDAEGRISVIWESWAAHIRLTDDFPERTGIPASRNMVKTWLLAGFVEGKVGGTNSTWVDLSSLKRFLDKISVPQAREFWTEETQQRYLEAKAQVYASGLKSRVRRAKDAVDDDEEEAETLLPVLPRDAHPTFDFFGETAGCRPDPEEAA